MTVSFLLVRSGTGGRGRGGGGGESAVGGGSACGGQTNDGQEGGCGAAALQADTWHGEVRRVLCAGIRGAQGAVSGGHCAESAGEQRGGGGTA